MQQEINGSIRMIEPADSDIVDVRSDIMHGYRPEFVLAKAGAGMTEI